MMRGRRVVKGCIEQWRANTVCLQETKLQGNLQEIVKQLWGRRGVNFACLEASVKFSILINGAPEGFFASQRGIRQGDPLSPFSFIFAMEGLNNMIKTAKDSLHINGRKSHVYPINLVPNIDLLASILEGGVGALPSIYLGMPLKAKSKSNEIWDSVLEKCKKKLSRWKAQYLFIGSRLTLVNAVLDALPTYMLTLFPIPTDVVQRLEKIKIRLRDAFSGKETKPERVIT
ncbi:uncharacterized protein LOC124898055 [Capsicum annuum]|uniref:uncharacterized protein LOC124898055 n=1 Tax=Capsicum annuum TaxID=4072 RepID=UPI001FB178B6|nr:uncharacterized protein LOC124898055 [Capsicum annuum]